MSYIEGFVAAVPEANKEAYRRHAADAFPLFEEFGVSRMMEAWESDVPDGKVTDREIADKSGRSYNTVRTYVRRLYARYGVSNRMQLLRALGK